MSVPEAVLDVLLPVGETTVFEPRFVLAISPALPMAREAFASVAGSFAAMGGAFAAFLELVPRLLDVGRGVTAFGAVLPEEPDRDWPTVWDGGG